jgi:hypothetical protein
VRSLQSPSHAFRTRRRAKVLLLGTAALGLGATGFALAGKSRLLLTSKGPVPATVSVAWGDTLEVKNADAVAHTLVSSHRELQGVIQPGQTYTTAFTSRTRTYDYTQTGGKAHAGKVVVSFSGYVSLQASNSLVAYGRTVRLSGHSSIHSTPVAVEVRRGGDARWRVLRTFASDAGGAFAGALRLQRGGKLRATIAAGQIRSRMRVVTVRPRIAIGVRGASVWGRLTPARAASRLTLQCRLGPGRWKRLAATRPAASGVASFRARAGGHVLARVLATRADAVPGYTPQSSRAIAVALTC